MATTSTSFTSITESTSHHLKAAEDLTLAISGTWVGSVQLERALNRAPSLVLLSALVIRQ